MKIRIDKEGNLYSERPEKCTMMEKRMGRRCHLDKDRTCNVNCMHIDFMPEVPAGYSNSEVLLYCTPSRVMSFHVEVDK